MPFKQKWPEALESQNASDKSSNLTLSQAPKTHQARSYLTLIQTDSHGTSKMLEDPGNPDES